MSDVRPFIDATEIAGDADAVRRRFDRDGYLFVRGLLPPPVVEDLRRQFLPVLRDAQWIAADSPADDQIADLSAFAVEPEPEYQKVYNRLYSVPAFHALQHRSELMDLMERVLDATVMPQPRVIARVMFPERTAYTTPAHQDFRARAGRRRHHHRLDSPHRLDVGDGRARDRRRIAPEGRL